MTVITAHRQLEGGGFEVRRPLPSIGMPTCDPFLLLDHMGPKDYAPGQAVGAPDHPHRGFETVTYLIEGAWEHKDSHGNVGRLGPGDVQWMTAGSGVVHSEMPAPELVRDGGVMHGFQLWVNLPAADKMMDPRYQELTADEIPRAEFDGGWAKVLSGEFEGVAARIDTRIPIQFLHLHLEAGATSVTAPADHNGFVYVFAGEGKVGGHAMRDGQAQQVEGTVTLEGSMDALFLSGRPIGEPVSRYGPFVMNTREEIYDAVRDYQAGDFGTISPDLR